MSNNLNATDGENITLTCTTSTLGVTTYEFMLDSSSLVNGPNNTYSISSATINSDDGNYSCIAYIDTVASNISNILEVLCK